MSERDKPALQKKELALIALIILGAIAYSVFGKSDCGCWSKYNYRWLSQEYKKCRKDCARSNAILDAKKD